MSGRTENFNYFLRSTLIYQSKANDNNDLAFVCFSLDFVPGFTNLMTLLPGTNILFCIGSDIIRAVASCTSSCRPAKLFCNYLKYVAVSSFLDRKDSLASLSYPISADSTWQYVIHHLNQEFHTTETGFPELDQGYFTPFYSISFGPSVLLAISNHLGYPFFLHFCPYFVLCELLAFLYCDFSDEIGRNKTQASSTLCDRSHNRFHY